jgi:RimJ/RimL family protein N-acetyltransferase
MFGSRVRLRPLRQDDRTLLYQWIIDRELVILNAPYLPVSQSDHEAWIDSMLVKRADVVLFVIEDSVTGCGIGTCQLLNINCVHRNAELQIRIGNSSSQSKGLGTEAIELLINFGFKDLNLHRIYLHVFATNERAVRAYKKCGFVTEGVLRQAAHIDGKFLDVLCMALLRTAHA